MNALKDNDFFAKSTQEDFALRALNFHFVSFYETLPMHGLYQVSSMKLLFVYLN
jgi:hypothetical protein